MGNVPERQKIIKDMQQNTSDVLKDTLTQVVQGITGIASSEKKELALSIGHILQRLLAGERLSAFKKEWDNFKAKGRVKDDYERTEQHKTCLYELLSFLNDDLPDEIRFSTLKAIFFVAASEKISDRNSILPLQFMQICRTLNSAEIIILHTVYMIAKNKLWDKEKDRGASLFLERIARESGLNYPELVEIYEGQLINKRLLTPRRFSDGSGITVSTNFRLTNLGYEICSYIANYDEIKESK